MASSKLSSASLSLTLPISCQICLGKVKEPVVCPNQHVFCSPCLDLWLRANRFCPTCRTPINQDQPCKKILGSMDLQINSDAVTRAELRRTRLELIRQEYECYKRIEYLLELPVQKSRMDDIVSLQNTIDRLKVENKRLHEQLSEQDKTISALHVSAGQRLKADGEGGVKVCSDIDMLLKLTAKLQEASTTYEQLRDDMTKTKEENKNLREENDMLVRQTARMKDDLLFNKSPQRFGRYSMTGMQTKVSQYEKEVQQLRKALDRSDQYIEDLNTRLQGTEGKQDVRTNDSTQRRTQPTATVTSISQSGGDAATTSSGSRRSSLSQDGGTTPTSAGPYNGGGGGLSRRESSASDILPPQDSIDEERPTMVPVCSFPTSTSALNTYTPTPSHDILSSSISEAVSALETADQWLKASPNKLGTSNVPDVFYQSESAISRLGLDTKGPRDPMEAAFPASRQLKMLSERLRGRQPVELPPGKAGRLDFSAPSPTSSDGGKLPRTLDFDVLVEGSMNDDSPHNSLRLETLSPRVETSASDLTTVSAAASFVMTKIKTEMAEPGSSEDAATQAKRVKLEKDHLLNIGEN